MYRDTARKKVLETALNRLGEETGLIATTVRHDYTLRNQGERDNTIKIKAKGHEYTVYFNVEVVKQITRATVGTATYKFRELGEQALLVTEYVTPDLALKFRENGVQFIDTCGNAFINALPYYIFVRGNRRTRKQRKYGVGQRAFRKTGLKVIFAFLCHPGFENAPIRQIAEVAEVAVGTVDAVFKNLKEIGLLVERGRFGRELLHKEKLLERWVTGYQETVRNGLIIGRFTAKDKYWWQDTQLPENFYWGGEVAAARITRYLKPETITVYTQNAPEKLLVQNKLRRDPKGEIEILKAFWGKEKEMIYRDTVHPVLIYADLLATGDERNLEAAKLIFEKDVHRLIRQA